MRKAFLFATVLFFFTRTTEGIAQTPLWPRNATLRGPQTFAVIIGISKYRFIRSLTYADKDALLFRDFLKSPGGGQLKDENIFLLTNEDATSGNFWSKGFQWLTAKDLQKGDRLFIYLAGHGDAIDEDQFFFLGYDCNPNGDKNNYLVGGAIQLYNLKKKIAAETNRGIDVFFVMDACRSNELPGGATGQSFLNTAVSQKKAGEIMMLAAAAGQESLEDASIGNGHGLFTYYLVDGLSGMADSTGSRDNKVTFSEIRTYVDKNVPSIAQQRFKRIQVPYFCCDENSDKIISTVDPAYLQKWLQSKKKTNRGGPNFLWLLPEKFTRPPAADTSVTEVYNRFYKEIKSKNFSGSSSAESWYLQLARKFPGTPYEMDAKSTLAAEYINDAQKRVDDYLSCLELKDPAQKKENANAGYRLERAMTLIGDYAPEYAESLRGRVYFLKSNGDYNNPDSTFNYAYAARRLDPNSAYINNWLAQLHWNNNRRDSALYYAEKAVKGAPNWPCAVNLLTLIRAGTGPEKIPAKKREPGKGASKNSFGFVLGGGINKEDPSFQENRNSTIVGVTGKNKAAFNLGILYQLALGPGVSLRPCTRVSFENSDLVFERRSVTGGPSTFETIALKNTVADLSVPIIIHFSRKNISPFISLGPSYRYIIKQDDLAAENIPLKKSIFSGDAGLGLDIGLAQSGLVLSPELKYTAGFSNMKETSGSAYANSVSSLKKRAITFSVYIRKK